MLLQVSKTSLTFACCAIACSALFCSGCEAPPASEAPNQESVKEESIIGKTTQDIGEYDPNGDAEIADLQVDADASPLGAAAGAYKFAAGRTSELKIQQALQLYNALHGDYPKDHAEFMEGIVKANNIQLPVLPGKRRYQYDVANHKLVVVEAAKKSETSAE